MNGKRKILKLSDIRKKRRLTKKIIVIKKKKVETPFLQKNQTILSAKRPIKRRVIVAVKKKTTAPTPKNVIKKVEKKKKVEQEQVGLKIRRLDKILRTRFPTWRRCRPLAIGIDKELKERYGDQYSTRTINALMESHTKKKRYLSAMVNAKHRYTLGGHITGEVTQLQHEIAQKTINTMPHSKKSA